MIILNENELMWESYAGGIQYAVNSDEESDETKIEAFYKNDKIGEAIAKLLFGDFYYEFDDVMDEDDVYDMFPDDTLVKIEHVEVDKQYRGSGVAKEMMNRLMGELEQQGFKQFYLNASPMGIHKGFDKSELVNFYKKFGFDVLLDQGGNTLMIKKL
jgi:GNAT superfamily N-acetyltransferase